MNFKVGDFVKIVRTGKRQTYQCVLNKVGKIVYIKHYAVNTPYEEHTYYVAVDGVRNQNQEQGWWCFDEKDLWHIGSTHKCFIVDDVVRPKQTYCDSLDCVDYACQMIENRFKEKKNMELLEIYKNKKIEELLVKRNKEIEKIKDSDVEYKSLKMTIKALTPKQLTCLSVDLSDYEFGADIEDKIHNKSEEYDNKRHAIIDLISEIRAQLDMCDTYEQKQNILKAYKVIDDQGKLL